MAKPHITRTLGPTHFEDLEPHRFEDLVRQLAYDLKPWQSIESTGRGGADDGFDIRAYEASPPPSSTTDEGEEEEPSHPMEGNLWMIQCKREKEVGPKRVEDIIRDTVNPATPPYGYILAAPVHFSKAAHDAFRASLRERGVMEFYLWGAGELEDMLYQPKNDHILFGFFGISLTSRRRSRTTEIRASVNAKNKLMRVLGDSPRHERVLLRDLKDEHYPYASEYSDFDRQPRWKEYHTVMFHPLGLIVSEGRYYAYINKRKSEWDFTGQVNTAIPAKSNGRRRKDEKSEELRDAAKGFWEQLPRANRATLVRNGLIRFEAMALVDDKGDTEYDCPHLFVDFSSERGPLSGVLEYLEITEHKHESLDGLKRVEIFPPTLPKASFGTIYKDKVVSLDERTRGSLRYNRGDVTIYDSEDRLGYLKPTDVIGVEAKDAEGKQILLKITNVRMASGKELLDSCDEYPPLKQEIEDQLARQLRPGDGIRVLEALIIHDWQIAQNRPVI